ncbi:MAG: MarR family transcriptional regulator [Thermodesulfobacteriota bacterium]
MKPMFTIFPREKSPARVIFRAAILLKLGLARAFEDNGFDVTLEQWGLLTSLRENEGIYQSALAEKTLKDRHNVTRILSLLEKAALVRRELHPTDKRRQRVFLTDKGKTVQAALLPVAIGVLGQAFDGLSQEDLVQMTRILGRIIENLLGSRPV